MKTYASTTDKFNYLGGFANFVVVSLVVWLLYRLFLHPEPVFITMMKINSGGLSLVTVFLSSVVMIVFIIGYYPARIDKMNPVFRGVILLLVSVLLAAIIYFIIFRNVIGRFAIAYFSPDSIMASGGTGAEPLNALIQSSIAILYFHIGLLWIAFLWKLTAGDWPWYNCTHPVVASSRVITILFVAIILYAVLFHPAICYLFSPPEQSCC